MPSTEKLLPPGMMPGKDELEIYRKRYEDPAFSLVERIEAFDSAVLPEKTIREFARRYPVETGVQYDGEWLEPVLDRKEFLDFVYTHMEKRELLLREDLFRKEPDEKAYQKLRKAFASMIGAKIRLDYVTRLAESMSEIEHRREKKVYQAKVDAFNREREIRKKIAGIAEENPDFLEDLEEYELSEEELDVLDVMLQERREEAMGSPPGWTEVYDSRKGWVSVPMLSAKLRLLRKALKMTQRDFARKIGYKNVNRYSLLEQGRLQELGLSLYEAFPRKLIQTICETTGANPYWLNNENENSVNHVDPERIAKTKKEAWDDWAPQAMFFKPRRRFV